MLLTLFGGLKLTARSELFVTETVRDTIEEVLEKYSPEEGNPYASIIGGSSCFPSLEVEIPKNWLDIGSDAAFPDEGEASISVDGIKVGTVKWDTKFSIEQGESDERYIVAEPELTSLVFRGNTFILKNR
jgi:hypothetical protein